LLNYKISAFVHLSGKGNSCTQKETERTKKVSAVLKN
jgi:hypothetical protein